MKPMPVLTLLTFLPFVGGMLILAMGRRQPGLARTLGVASAVLALLVTTFLFLRFDPEKVFCFEESLNWIPSLGVRYHLGLDGLSLLMVVLTSVVVLMSLLASWKDERLCAPRVALILFLQMALFGAFTSLNFFHWFLFWELSLVPAFFLIRLWGDSESSQAATQFFVYTMVGSVFLLLSFVGVFLATGTFEFPLLASMARNGELFAAISRKFASPGWNPQVVAVLLFIGAFLGFAVKVPLVPFHTWLPAAYTSAPSTTTMLLTGLMSKLGVYGFLRILLPIFPDQFRWALPMLFWVCIATIVFSSAAALAQTDLKRIFAYSSINHLGYCFLGICAVASSAESAGRHAALTGVFLQMFNHGITAAALFWFVAIIEERTGGRRDLPGLGGLRTVAPLLACLMGTTLFANLGLPGLNGFISEFLIFKGAFAAIPWTAAASMLGLLLTAVFVLRVIQQTFHGRVNSAHAAFPDLTFREALCLSTTVLLMLIIGIYPQLLLGPVNATVMRFVAQLPP